MLSRLQHSVEWLETGMKIIKNQDSPHITLRSRGEQFNAPLRPHSDHDRRKEAAAAGAWLGVRPLYVRAALSAARWWWTRRCPTAR